MTTLTDDEMRVRIDALKGNDWIRYTLNLRRILDETPTPCGVRMSRNAASDEQCRLAFLETINQRKQNESN